MSDDLLLDRYLADVAKQRSAATTRVARIHVAGFRRFLSGRSRTLLEAAEDDFHAFVPDRFAAGATQKGVMSKYSHIRLFYAWCVQEGIIPINLATAVTISQGPSTRAVPTAEDINRLFAYADAQIDENEGTSQALRLSLRIKVWLHLLVEAAAWPGEIAPLLLDDLDDTKQAVRLGRDTPRDRVRSLSPKGWTMVIRYRKAAALRFGSRDGYLFPAEKSKSSGCFSVDRVTTALVAFCRDAGLPRTITPIALSRIVVQELQDAAPESVRRVAVARRSLRAAVAAEPAMDVEALRHALERWHPLGRL
jgi:site-specific recombinase XerD